MKYLAFSPLDGVLRYYYEAPDTDDVIPPTGLWLHQGDVSQDMLNTHYMLAEVLTARPNFLVNDVLAAVNAPVVFSGLPVGTTVVYPNGSIVVNDGFIEWASDTPGEYEFKFSLWPYLDKIVYARIT